MNLFKLPEKLPEGELCEILQAGHGVRVERVVSRGHASPDGFWYDQQAQEWVAVLAGEGVIAYPDGREVTLRPGDTLFLPAHQKHRVARTTKNPPCIWLCVFFD